MVCAFPKVSTVVRPRRRRSSLGVMVRCEVHLDAIRRLPIAALRVLGGLPSRADEVPWNNGPLVRPGRSWGRAELTG